MSLKLNTKEAIVLVGGLGTRLRSVVNDRPKPMADFNGQPFLSFLLSYLQRSGIERVILSAGYKASYIKQNLNSNVNNMSVSIIEESEPLGTGGAVKNAVDMIQGERFFVLNGDSFCHCDLSQLELQHQSSGAQITMLMTQVDDASAFGTVNVGQDNRLIAFKEKSSLKEPGLVNSGVYLFETTLAKHFPFTRKFSLEHDFFPKVLSQIGSFKVDSPLFDIGTPSSYRNACQQLG